MDQVVPGETVALTKLTRGWSIIASALGVPAFFLLASEGYADKGIVAGLSIALLILISRRTWPLRRRRWYWPLLLAWIVAHAAAVSMISFPRQKLLITVTMPVAIADFVLMLSAFWYAEKWSKEQER